MNFEKAYSYVYVYKSRTYINEQRKYLSRYSCKVKPRCPCIMMLLCKLIIKCTTHGIVIHVAFSCVLQDWLPYTSPDLAP